MQTWTGNNAQVLTLTPTQVVDLERSGEPLGRDLERDLLVLVGDRDLVGALR